MNNLPKMINQFSVEFDHLCDERHRKGQREYGAFSFLEKDMIEEAINEIVDGSNYFRYMFIKLRLIQIALSEDPRLEQFVADEEMSIGLDSFHTSGEPE